MVELKDHEEKAGYTRSLGARHGVNPGAKTWKELRDEETEQLGAKTQPYVLVIGGGQGGIALGARLRQLGVPTIIVEKNERAGNSWRNRYKSLCLHDPVWYDHLPYIDFPKNWPVFSPKDKIGDWLEMYSKVMELNYWTGTTAKHASWDDAKKEWNVVVERGGKEITLKPKQLVFATGMSAKPNMPQFKGMDTFKGEQHHSSRHPGPDRYKGKKIVVIGSNNSAHDICAALYEAGVDVTMVQRSTTHIVRSDSLMESIADLYSERAVRGGMTTAKADLIFASLPYKILNQLQKPVYDKIRKDDADFYAGLTKAGFRLDFGDDDSGLFMKYLRRGSGYYIDVGASQLIIDGKVKLVTGQVEEITPSGVKLDNGKELPADVIVYATGYSFDERLCRRSHQPGNGRQGWQGLGARLQYDQGPRSMGRRAAQHVEADAAGGPMVPRRQSAPVAPLLAVPLAAVESALRAHPDAGPWPASRPSQVLGFHNARSARA